MLPTSTDVSVTLGNAIPPTAQGVAIFLHKGAEPGTSATAALTGPLRRMADALLASGAVTGKSNEVTVQLVPDPPRSRRLIVIGLGNPAKYSAECLREGGAALARTVHKQRLSSVAMILPLTPRQLPGMPDGQPVGDGPTVGVEALVQGFLLGAFDFREDKGPRKNNKDEEPPPHVNLTVVAAMSLRSAVQRGRIIAEAQNYARTIASRPGNRINPPALAVVAQDLAKQMGLECRILDEKQLEQLGMGGILAVGRGSIDTPPRLIVLSYHPGGAKAAKHKSKPASGTAPVLVVGKAITFDTGGISIKPAEKMGRMIYDKCGGMAVLGLMSAVAQLKPEVPVVGILSSAENTLSQRAYRPGDVVRMYNGVTVEVTNTDAEGRLVLGDALAWGIEQFKPSAVIDLATLTGGVIVALGRNIAGMISNNDALADELRRASRAAGEKLWRLPLGDEQREQIKSERADIVNSAGRDAQPLQGGAFLSHFVPEGVPWAHLDIAGVADTEKDLACYGKGATGWGVRTLVEWVTGRAGR